jgi:hypothetical protein
MTLHVSAEILARTLSSLASATSVESVVLWLAKNTRREEVVQCFVPEHIARKDMFQLTPRGMADLRRVLRENRWFIAAQLHTHPFEAFHSPADDRWALVRHTGALSIVLPYFAQSTSVTNFSRTAAVFEMSEQGQWMEVSPLSLETRLLVDPASERP